MNKIFVFLLLMLLTACRNVDNVSPDPNLIAPEGIVTGKVTSQNGTTAIGGAHVFTFNDSNSLISSTYSDSEGNFVLTAPAGNRKIYIQTGTGAYFRTDFSTNIIENQTTTLPAETTRLQQVAKIGFAEGVFDNTEEVLINMGYTVNNINNDLVNMNQLSTYDIIYLQTGNSIESMGTQLFTNLSHFVSNGGNIYSSNWAANYLVGGDLYPTDCNMAGGFIPDDKLCVKWRYNTTAPTSSSQILNERLRKAVGFSDFNLVLMVGGDSYISGYDTNYWETIIRDNEKTHLIKTKNYTNPSAPSLMIGNAANDGWKTVCYKEAPQSYTIRVPQNIADVLVSKGAQLGSCTGNSKSGTIYYNLFHSERGNPAGNTEKNMKIIKSCILDF